SMSQVSSLSRPGGSQGGTCPVCRASVQIVSSTGMLWKHGHTRTDPPCPGSYHPPLGFTAINSTPSSSSSSSSASHGCQNNDGAQSQSSLILNIAVPQGPILARIPKGARSQAAAELDKRLIAVARTPNDVNCWIHLLGFAGAFIQPSRGGKKLNLTSLVIKQLGKTQLGGMISPAQPDNARPRDTRKQYSYERSEERRVGKEGR